MVVKTKNIPTTVILMVLSWLIVVFGFLGGSYLMLARFTNPKLFFSGLMVVLVSILLGTIVRVLGNISQIFFNISSFLYSQILAISKELSGMNNSINSLSSGLSLEMRQVLAKIDVFEERIDCTLKDKFEKIDNSVQSLSSLLSSAFEKINETLQLLPESLSSLNVKQEIDRLDNSVQSLSSLLSSASEDSAAQRRSVSFTLDNVNSEIVLNNNGLKQLNEDINIRLEHVKVLLRNLSQEIVESR